MEIPDVSGLIKTTVLKTKISNLVKKRNYDAKISDIEKTILDHYHCKYITTQKFNCTKKLTASNFAPRL